MIDPPKPRMLPARKPDIELDIAADQPLGDAILIERRRDHRDSDAAPTPASPTAEGLGEWAPPRVRPYDR